MAGVVVGVVPVSEVLVVGGGDDEVEVEVVVGVVVVSGVVVGCEEGT